MKFVNLHGHTSFSYGDGHGLPKDHAKRVSELGMTAMAITEHGNVSSHVQLEKACKEYGIKPIYGVEAYVAPPKTKAKFHQTILAINEQGYRQLNRLVTRSYEEGFFHYPTIHPEWLFEAKDTSGLMILSGCADSWLSCSLAGGKSLGESFVTTEDIHDKAARLFEAGLFREFDELQDKVDNHYDKGLNLALRFKEAYGDRYFLELQLFDNYARTCHLNRCVEDISLQAKIPVVATGDVHYPMPEDWEVQRLSNAIKWNVPVAQLAENRDYEAGKCAYPTSDREVAERLLNTGVSKPIIKEAILNTRVIADRCTVELPKTEPVRFSESNGTEEDARRILKQKIMEGIKYRKETSPFFAKDFGERELEYRDRLLKELKVILHKKGFPDYFLVNWQIIGWAKDNGIAVGPGRGSAASSLVCYLLRLTEVNPMEFPEMVFERFLDPGRDDEPDIDTDYEDERRNEVFDFARKIYGEANVGNIGNFARYRGKSVIKAAGKAYGIGPEVFDFADLISTPPYGDPREFDSAEDAAIAFKEAREIVERNPDLKVAYRLEGDMSTLGIHAAGMVISNRPISDTCAIYKRQKTNGDEAEVIAYDKRDASYLQMLKLDCLGLKTMTIVSDVIEMVPELTLEKMYALTRDDQKTLEAFGNDDLTGIFQFEGRSTRGIVKDIFLGKDKSPTFMQLADINALSRPGSLSSGMTRQYIAVENGAPRKKIHPVVDEVLAGTNGCLVYQEQVMRIGKVFGGLDDSEVGRLRKIIGAKQMGGAFEAFWEKFKTGAMELHGVEEHKAREVWEYMAASASYLFNVSHAISYALVAYWTQYLKQHYPAEFFTASLRSAAKKGKQKDSADPQLLLLQDAFDHNLTISPPHPATAGISWMVNKERTGIEAGFSQLPGVGLKTAEKMVLSRNEMEGVATWDSFADKKIGFGEKSAEKAREFCEKVDPFDIHKTNQAIVSVIQSIREYDIPLSQPNVTSATLPKHDGEIVTYVGHVVAVKIIDYIAEVRQRENLTHEEAMAKIESPELNTKAKIICADAGGTEVHVNVSRFKYPELAEEIAEIDTSKGTFAVWTEGKANCGFGPAVQAYELSNIELEE